MSTRMDDRLTHPRQARALLVTRLLGPPLAAGVVAHLAADSAHHRFRYGQIRQIEATPGAWVDVTEMLEVNRVECAAFRTLDRTLARRSAAAADRIA